MNQIEFLKENCQMIHYFGLGFIQIKLKNCWEFDYRLHLYSTKYESIIGDDNAHNHRYNFRSRILKGKLYQHIFDFEPHEDGNWIKEFESCKKDIQINSEPIRGDLITLPGLDHYSGTEYFIDHRTFHGVETNIDTITLVQRFDIKKDAAEVIFPFGKEKICPFSKQIDEKELWQTVEEMIDGIDINKNIWSMTLK